ncbi:MAG TPA: hypothetical protein VFM88_02020, partial [Vicinamibacteria bacterium]|nr:hypothetical protein [Vicinamibacteria bacterium]
RPALLLVALAATFSRSWFALGAGWLIARALLERPRRVWRLGLSAALVLAYVAVSHVGLVWSEKDRRALRLHVGGPPLACLGSDGGAPCVYATVYRFTKAASLEAIARTWPWGVGPGRQPEFEAQLKTEGLYPGDMPAYRPHSSYTGVPAEYGAAGLVGLVVFGAGVVVTTRSLLRRGGEERVFAARAAGALAMIAIEALTTDVMHFRHLFWLVAVVGAHAANGKQESHPRPE